MAAPGKLSVECSGESDLSFIATSHGTFASPTFSSLPATHSGQGLSQSRLHISSQGSSQSRLHISSLGSSQSRVFIDGWHYNQVEKSDPTNSLPPVVIKVVVNGDDVKTVNVGRDQEDVAIKLQVCDPSKEKETSDPVGAFIFKSLSEISMATAIKLFMLFHIVFIVGCCVALLKGNVVNIHSNNVYNHHLPTNKMDLLPVNSTGDGNHRSGDAASVKNMKPALNSITGDDNKGSDAAVPVNKMVPLPVDSTGEGNYKLGEAASVSKMEPTFDSSTDDDNLISDKAVSEESEEFGKSTHLIRPNEKIASKKLNKQIMPQPGWKDYLSLLFSAQPPQCTFQSNQQRILQSEHKNHSFCESSRTQANVRSRLAYSWPDDQEDMDVEQLQKEQKKSTMTKDFTALAMQGDSSSKQEAKSATGAGQENLTQGLGSLECLISPLLQVLAVTVSLFIATFAFAKNLLQLLSALTKRLNCFLDNGKQYLSTGRSLISSSCINLWCHVVDMLLPSHVPRYFGMMFLMCMECSESAYGESPDSFDSGTLVTGDRIHVHSNQRRRRQGEDVKPADSQSDALTVPKNLQNVSTSNDDAHKNTDPDASYVQNQFDDADRIKGSDDPCDETENDGSSLDANEVNNVQDFRRGIIEESDSQSSLAQSSLEDPFACAEEYDNEGQRGIPSLPENADIIYDDSVETDAGDHETALYVPRHLNAKNAFLDSVKRQERDFEQPILPIDVQPDERLHMAPKRKYIWPHQHCIHGKTYDMMNFILGIESAVDGSGVFIQVSPLHVRNGGIQSWMVKPLSDSRTAYFDHMGEAPYIEEKVEIETFLQIRRKYEIYISHQDDDPDTLKIYGLKKSVEDDRHFVKIFYQCREARGCIHVFLTFQTYSRRSFNQVHRVPCGQTLKAVMACPAIHNFVSQLKQVYTILQDGCYMRLTLRGRLVYPSPSWRLNDNCLMEIVPSIKDGVLPSAPNSTQRCVDGQDELA